MSEIEKPEPKTVVSLAPDQVAKQARAVKAAKALQDAIEFCDRIQVQNQGKGERITKSDESLQIRVTVAMAAAFDEAVDAMTEWADLENDPEVEQMMLVTQHRLAMFATSLLIRAMRKNKVSGPWKELVLQATKAVG